MAIRDIVTMGYGNGTFSPGVNKIPTLGYSIGAALATNVDTVYETMSVIQSYGKVFRVLQSRGEVMRARKTSAEDIER